ncbi:hypothetical protein Fot_30429 [Forsythia ovata]|uniref:Uncharacterized protein n=1 Tax=Forsythia ovata TaxID=205694 RepID=A0ABD1TV60_9LAMI
MGDPTFTQPNAARLPPKPPNPVIIGGGHQPPFVHRTPAGLTLLKWDPIDPHNSSTAAALIETIIAPANSDHQHANEPILAPNIADLRWLANCFKYGRQQASRATWICFFSQPDLSDGWAC